MFLSHPAYCETLAARSRTGQTIVNCSNGGTAMKPQTIKKTQATKSASGKKLSLKGTTKSSAAISPRLAANHNETLITR
jgi:hypothetical protein